MRPNFYTNCIRIVTNKIKKLRTWTQIPAILNAPPILLIQIMIHRFQMYREYELTLVSKLLIDCMYSTARIERTSNDNKSTYINGRVIRNICLMKTHFDAAAGILCLSNFYYVMKQYYMAEHLCSRAIESITPKVFCPRFNYQLPNRLFMMYLLENEYSKFQQEVNILTASYVHVHKKVFYPSEIDVEMYNFDSNNIWQCEKGNGNLFIPPLPYAYFVLYLCAYHRHDVPTQYEWLNKLKSLLKNEHYGLCKIDRRTFIIFNMVGIGYELSCDTRRALLYYRKNVHIIKANLWHPYRKAAAIRIEGLTKKSTLSSFKVLRKFLVIILCLIVLLYLLIDINFQIIKSHSL